VVAREHAVSPSAAALEAISFALVAVAETNMISAQRKPVDRIPAIL
jgi:hypothetical protein